MSYGFLIFFYFWGDKQQRHGHHSTMVGWHSSGKVGRFARSLAKSSGTNHGHVVLCFSTNYKGNVAWDKALILNLFALLMPLNNIKMSACVQQCVFFVFCQPTDDFLLTLFLIFFGKARTLDRWEMGRIQTHWTRFSCPKNVVQEDTTYFYNQIMQMHQWFCLTSKSSITFNRVEIVCHLLTSMMMVFLLFGTFDSHTTLFSHSICIRGAEPELELCMCSCLWECVNGKSQSFVQEALPESPFWWISVELSNQWISFEAFFCMKKKTTNQCGSVGACISVRKPNKLAYIWSMHMCWNS